MVIYRRLPPKPRHYVWVRKRCDDFFQTYCAPTVRIWKAATVPGHLYVILCLALEFHAFGGGVF